MKQTKVQVGVMLDCSRGAVYSVEMLKKYIDVLKKMGFSSLQLYTEDTYEVEGEPYFGYLRGRYTAEELQVIEEQKQIMYYNVRLDDHDPQFQIRTIHFRENYSILTSQAIGLYNKTCFSNFYFNCCLSHLIYILFTALGYASIFELTWLLNVVTVEDHTIKSISHDDSFRAKPGEKDMVYAEQATHWGNQFYLHLVS